MKQTMKVTALAILALTGATEAANISGKEIQDRMNKMDKHSLLRKARVLENYGFQIDGSFNIEFDSCTSLSVLTDEVMESVGNGYGAFTSTKDYVVFTASNNYGSSQFAMDISTFATSMASTILTENENYCEVCAEAQQSCLYGSSNNAYYGGQQQNNGSNSGQQQNNGYQTSNGGNRNLEDATGDTEPIDCNTCKSVCSEQTYQGYTYQSTYYTEQAAEWLQEVAACQLMDYDNGYNLSNDNAYSKYGSYSSGSSSAYNGNKYQSQQQQQQQYTYQAQQEQEYEMYAGMMCNAAGTGMEIGVFMDEECTVWNSGKSFSSSLAGGSAPYNYYSKTKNLIEYIFTQPVSCKATAYYSPFDADYQQNYQNDDYNYNQYQTPESNEGCQSLFDGTQVSVSDSCYSGDDNENQGSYSGAYTYYSSNGWQTYTYDIMDTEDQFQICTSIQAQLSGSGTHTTNTQSKKKNLYNYKNNQKMEDIFEGSSERMGAMSGGDIFVIVIGVFLGIIGLYVFVKVCWSRRGNQDKKEALISSREIS
jgi:hypothetical protein